MKQKYAKPNPHIVKMLQEYANFRPSLWVHLKWAFRSWRTGRKARRAINSLIRDAEQPHDWL